MTGQQVLVMQGWQFINICARFFGVWDFQGDISNFPRAFTQVRVQLCKLEKHCHDEHGTGSVEATDLPKFPFKKSNGPLATQVTAEEDESLNLCSVV